MGLFIPGGKGYGSWGYRYYSMNLLSPFDPGGYGSIVRASLPHLTGGQYEGYNYLGAGIILLIPLMACLTLRRGQLKSLDKRWVVPLSVCCLVLTLLACTTKVSFGSHIVIDVDPHEKLTPFLATFRSSGRLFWVPYYTIVVAVLAVPLLLLRKASANVLLAVVLVLQVADSAPMRRLAYSVNNQRYYQPLRSSVWLKLGSLHKHLIGASAMAM